MDGSSRNATRTFLALVGLFVSSNAGCWMSSWTPFAKPPAAIKPERLPQVVINDAETPPKPATPTLNTAKFTATPVAENAADQTSWATDAWVAVIEDPLSEQPPTERWRHLGLEAALDLPSERQPNWRAEIASTDRIRSLNAAIAAARSGDSVGLTRLMSAIRDTTLDTRKRYEPSGLGRPISSVASCRLAAVEALGRLPPELATPAIEDLLKEFARFDGPAVARYSPEVHAELLYAWARVAPAGSEEPLRLALPSPSVLVSCAAVRGYLIRNTMEPSPELVDMLADPDTQVRLNTLRVLTAARHPEAFESACHCLNDADLSIKIGGLTSLGKLGGDHAKRVVEPYRRDKGEAVRAAATVALVRLGDGTALESALADSSAKVRRALVDTLKDDQNVELAERLLADKSNDVRVRTVESLNDWPWEKAAPPAVHRARERATANPVGRRQATARTLVGRGRPDRHGFARTDETTNPRIAPQVRRRDISRAAKVESTGYSVRIRTREGNPGYRSGRFEHLRTSPSRVGVKGRTVPLRRRRMATLRQTLGRPRAF
ncbi:MAG: HEAT repeat domain-containing protein [Pirellulales bacterium]